MRILLLAAIAQTAFAQSSELLELARRQPPRAIALAQNELQTCEKRGPCDSLRRISLLTGHLLLAHERAAESLSQLNQYSAPEGLDSFRTFYIGEALFALRRYDEAENTFALAAKESTSHWLSSKADQRRAQSIFMQGRLDEAATLLTPDAARSSTPELVYQLAYALDKVGKKRQALRFFRKLAVFHADHPLGTWATSTYRFEFSYEERIQRAKQFLNETHAEQAVEEARLALESADSQSKAAGNLVLAQAFFLSAKAPEAHAVLSSMSEDGAEWASQALMMAGKEAMRQNQDVEADRAFLLLETKYPLTQAAPEARFLRAFMALHRNQFDTCGDLLSAFSDTYPSWSRLDEAKWNEALCHLRANRFQNTKETLFKLIEKFPGSALLPQARYWIIRTQELDGSVPKDQLLKLWQAFRAQHPGTVYALWSEHHLRRFGKLAEAPFKKDLKKPIGGPPDSLKRALLLASCGLFDDSLSEVQSTMHLFRAPQSFLEAAPHLVSIGADAIVFSLASRRLKNPLGKYETARFLYPAAYRTTVETNAQQFSIPTSFVWAIMKRESRFLPYVESPVGARGLMQILPKTAKRIASEINEKWSSPQELFDPEFNIHLGSWYLAALQRRFGHMALSAAAYNAGPLSANTWLKTYGHLPLDLFVESIPFRETRSYVKQVLADEYMYRLLYDPVEQRFLHSFELPKASPVGVAF